MHRLFLIYFFFFACETTEPASEPIAELVQIEEPVSTLPIDKIQLPDGFEISVYADGVENARAMAMGSEGTLFVGSRRAGKVYAIFDADKDYRADKVMTIAQDLHLPTGIAYHNGDLYVAEVSKIWKYPNIEASLPDVPEAVLVSDAFPTDDHHGWKYLGFGPDGKLYVPVGAPCNVCEKENEIYSTICRMNADGSDLEIYAKGIRNSVGFTWHPTTDELWFTDNGRDHMGDDIPPCELNRAPQKDMHFGFPYCHGGTIPDTEFGDEAPCENFTQPVQNLGPHVAPLGLAFYTGDLFPAAYKNQIIIAEHGSWNRSQKIGYRLMMVTLDDNQEAVSYEPFATGWLEADESVWGRPVDVLNLTDGSLLVSDDQAGAVYRITY